MENGEENEVYEDAVGTSIPQDARISIASVQGGRRYMEDRVHVEVVRKEDGSIDYIYAGVYDGHGGAQASEYVRLHLLHNIRNQKSFESNNDTEFLHAIRLGFLKTHQNMQKISDTWPRTASGYACTAGTTASCLFIRDGKVYLGHVGDSAIFLFSDQDNVIGLKDKKLTEDHKPEAPEERTRIEMADRFVVIVAPFAGPPPRRTSPFLAIARSLGDFWSMNQDTHEYVVSPEPDLDVHTLSEKDTFIVLATDGLTNVFGGKAIAALLDRMDNDDLSGLSENSEEQTGGGETNHAHQVLHHALNRWGQLRADNISIICIKLKNDQPPSPQDIAVSEINMNIARELRNFPTAVIRVSNETTQRLRANPVRLVYNGAIDSVIKNTRLPSGFDRTARAFEGPGFVIPEMTRKVAQPADEEPSVNEPLATADTNQEVPDIPIFEQSLPEIDVSMFPSTSVLIPPLQSPNGALEPTANVQNGIGEPVQQPSAYAVAEPAMPAIPISLPAVGVPPQEDDEEIFEEASSQSPTKPLPNSTFMQASTSTLSGQPLSPYTMLEALRTNSTLARSTYLSQLTTSFTFTRSVTVSPRKSTIPERRDAAAHPVEVSHTRLTRTMGLTNAPPRPLKRGLARAESEEPLTQATAPKRSRLWSFVSDVFARYTSSH
ncbi:Protein phosphatase 2C containing protein [Aphelenchoides avenae]|nr:Protein phosphatase 2C containing protein [Aphelenchus avenae]